MVRRGSIPGALRGLVALAMLGLAVPGVGAQARPDTASVEADVAAAVEDLDVETGDATLLVEGLEELAAHPLDINTATAADLAAIPAFGPLLAARIVAYRATLDGGFRSIPELRAVAGLTPEVFRAARPYLAIDPTPDGTPPRPRRFPAAPSWREITGGLRYELIQRVTRRLDLGRGFDDDTSRTTYAGSPERVYTRLRARYRRQVSLNLTLEKDPGEGFGWDPAAGTYGFDHASAHLALRDFGRLETLIVGDFEAAFGQGVVLWRGIGFGKGRDTVQPLVRTGTGFRPYGSTDENRFFRGLAATVRLTPRLALSGFASRRTLDATVLAPDTTDVDAQAITLSTAGLHRTPTEIDKKDALREAVFGGHLGYTFGHGAVGLVGYRSRFAAPFRPPSDPVRRFDFAGDTATMVGLYGHLVLGDLLLFGEGARTQAGVLGGVGGVTVKPSAHLEGVLLVRHYPRDFVSLHGFAFGERNGATQNETGVYLGLRLTPAPTWRVDAYVDQYRFPWLRFTVPRPSRGHDALARVEHRPRPWLTVYLQARAETKEVGTDARDAGGRLLDALTEATRQSLRLHGDYAFSRALRVRARLEAVRAFDRGQPAAYGVILYQDVRWLPRPWLQLDARLAHFSSDTFDARVFAYENDLLYTFSVPAFSGRGRRAYLLARLTPFDGLTLQIKYALTRFEDAVTVGSGLDETEGSRLRELRFQLRWTF